MNILTIIIIHKIAYYTQIGLKIGAINRAENTAENSENMKYEPIAVAVGSGMGQHIMLQ